MVELDKEYVFDRIDRAPAASCAWSVITRHDWS